MQDLKKCFGKKVTLTPKTRKAKSLFDLFFVGYTKPVILNLSKYKAVNLVKAAPMLKTY